MTVLNKLSGIIFILVFTCSSMTMAAGWSSQESEPSSMSKAKKAIKSQSYELAIQYLKKTVDSDADNADAYNLLGYSHRKLKKYEVAENYYLQALKLEPNHRGALEYLGELYVETKRLNKANEMLARLDDACYLSCQEYRDLKKIIEKHQDGVKVSMKW